ncbi:MAG: HAMP domain-containing histidine kinase [Armatimonadetes bacterium]|nr:HAMP domain-containing histidine kinase [Armatimonadota bacterium]
MATEEENLPMTERHRLNAELVRAAAAASIGTATTRKAAHELRNLLAIISSNAELLFGHPGDKKILAECETRIFAAIERTGLILQSSIESVPFGHIRMTDVDVIAVLEECLNVLTDRTASNGVILKRDFRATLPKVSGSWVALRQVFTNLIANALKAMPQGGKLTVTALAQEQNVEIRFRDTGCGMAQKHTAQIFDPLFTTNPAGEGTGMGLPISRYIVEQHNGTIAVESEVNRGSTFIVSLPSKDRTYG